MEFAYLYGGNTSLVCALICEFNDPQPMLFRIFKYIDMHVSDPTWVRQHFLKARATQTATCCLTYYVIRSDVRFNWFIILMYHKNFFKKRLFTLLGDFFHINSTIKIL